MHFITCKFCDKIKKTNKKKIVCSGCGKNITYEDEISGYDYEQDIREIPESKNGICYKLNPNVNVFLELAKAAVLKDYKIKHKYEVQFEEDEDER